MENKPYMDQVRKIFILFHLSLCDMSVYIYLYGVYIYIVYVHTHTHIYIYTLCEYCGYGSEVVYFFQYVAMTITQYSYPFVEYVLIKNDGFRLLDLIGRISGTLEIHSSSIAPMGTSRTLGVGVAPTA